MKKDLFDKIGQVLDIALVPITILFMITIIKQIIVIF